MCTDYFFLHRMDQMRVAHGERLVKWTHSLNEFTDGIDDNGPSTVISLTSHRDTVDQNHRTVRNNARSPKMPGRRVVFCLPRWCRLNTSVNHYKSPSTDGPLAPVPPPSCSGSNPTQNVDARYNTFALGYRSVQGDSSQQRRVTSH